MADYATEIERIFEEHDRQIGMIRQEREEQRRLGAQRDRDFREQAPALMRQIAQEYERTEQEAEKARAEAEEQERREAEMREQQDAIARAAAYRRANQNVRAVDDEDEDDDYYRRKSWLV
ncbi:hypothetical protein KO481_08415 [Nocardia sp. NEAU-G5]|uniref:Uncharacterized protein n=1 Tax=Nocardia albiluteola TaxID=2842303 RepID=A0ABS6AVI1_9NOCA|nr:hypothetical protein [Nocardia albiluteola]MBU3061545.1 hypothetical protein [Nocardia albiluteola]